MQPYNWYKESTETAKLREALDIAVVALENIGYRTETLGAVAAQSALARIANVSNTEEELKKLRERIASRIALGGAQGEQVPPIIKDVKRLLSLS